MKKLSFIAVCFALYVSFQTNLNAQSHVNKIVIDLEVLKPLKNIKDINGGTFFSGSIKVKIQNRSKQVVKLLDLKEHNILLRSKNESNNYVPFHSCSCVLLKKRSNSFITIEPGKSKILTYNGWSCDGGSFGLLKKGKYSVFFRTHEKEKLRKNISYLKFQSNKKSSIQEIIKDCKILFNNEKFWKNAIYSSSVDIKI